METLQGLWMGFMTALSPVNLMLAAAGVTIGMLVGVLPGLGASAGVAILIPLTFNLEPVSALIMLSGIYYGAMYGGTIPSVLINTPGESATVVTTFDGYQMALQGQAGRALGIATIASFIAGTVSVVAFMFLAPPLSAWAVSFGPPEYFALMIMGFCTLSSLVGETPLRGLAMAAVGVLISMVGIDIMTGHSRFTFGSPELLTGIDFLPIAVGFFGLAEVFKVSGGSRPAQVSQRVPIRELFPTVEDWLRSRWAIVRGTVIGFAVGLLPGAGTTLASFLSYSVEKQVSRHPEQFGRGAIEGVAGPEAANNAGVAGAMVPMLTLGIPGSGTTAVMLGALLMHGVSPGPLLFKDHAEVAWGLIASMYIGNIMLVVLNIFFIPVFVYALRTHYAILAPFIVLVCTVGVYSVSYQMLDVWLMLACGVLGYFVRKAEYPVAPLVLGVVLGGMLERALRQSLLMSGGDPTIFVTRPLSLALLVISLAAVLVPMLLPAHSKRRRPGTVAKPHSRC